MPSSAPQLAEEKVRRTIARFCHLTDTGDFDNWVRLFTEDGCFVLMDKGAAVDFPGPARLVLNGTNP